MEPSGTYVHRCKVDCIVQAQNCLVLSITTYFQLKIFYNLMVIYLILNYLFQDWILDIIALDHDRYANHTQLCTLTVPLKEVKRMFISPETHMLNYHMKSSNQVLKFYKNIN